MELTKKHELYVFNNTYENGWIATGNATIEVSGALSIWITMSKVSNDETVGSVNYTKPISGPTVFNVSSSEEDRKTLAAYADTLIDFVLDYFKN